MRFPAFIALLGIALALDLALLALGVFNPQARVFEAGRALAAPPASPTAAPSATLIPTATTGPTATATPPPTATASPTTTPLPTSTPLPTNTPVPAPRLLAAKAAAFTPSNRAVRANIRLALSLYQGALANVVLAPGEVFSFNAALGPRPQRLPWKYVVVKPTAVPTAAPGAEPAAPTPDPEVQRIQGGGLCDLASRFVMAARPLLPAKAFRFVNHLRSNGIRLTGVPARDSVSIWAVGGGPGEQDLKITNTTSGWLQFVAERDGEKITITALLWDQPPP